MFGVLIFTSADHLGRFDTSSLSDQALIELFVSGFNDVNFAKDANGDFIDIQLWKAVKFDKTGKLFSINMIDYGGVFHDRNPNPSIQTRSFCGGGSVDLKYIPPSVRIFRLKSMLLTGTIDTAALPPDLQIFDVNDSCFEGSFCVKTLPKELREVVVSHNQLSGSLDIENLPPQVRIFSVRNNNFSGLIHLCSLPNKLCTLDIQRNHFEGTLEIRNAPKSLYAVFAQFNNFAKDTRIIEVHDGLRVEWRDDALW